MITSLYLTLALSGVVFLIFVCLQLYFSRETRNSSARYCDFFYRVEDYQIIKEAVNGEEISQLKLVGEEKSDLNKLLSEINLYILKTKGTTDFSVIQNKVERMLNMLYEQAVSKLAFPTHLGLMGTFVGVFLGIIMFIPGFSGDGEIRDNSIKSLLFGVIVSMSTSFIGLLLTTWNTAKISKYQKEVEEDKNEFYNYIQTELMPSLDVSLVVAINKLHETVDKFEPAFESVIGNFQETFDRCTKAFGDSFEKNVTTVANAVDVMGKNMDKINENIELQRSVLSTFKSDEVVRGLEKYVEAADHFVGITQSLNKFEEARRMMLAAAQEAINLQNAYSESLNVPREIALRINQILDRVKNFEANIERLGDKLNEREILGNDVVNAIRDQVNGIEKKNKIAESYLQKADGELEDLFAEQTKVIGNLNSRYEAAISNHIDGFEDLMERLKEDIKVRHSQFLALMEDNLNVEMIHEDFSNLSKLDQLPAIRESINNLSSLEQLLVLKDDMNSIIDYLESTNRFLGSIDYYQKQVGNSGEDNEKSAKPVYVPTPSISDEDFRRVRRENQELRNDIQTLTGNIQIMANGMSQLITELKNKQQPPQVVPTHVYGTTQQVRPQTYETAENRQTYTPPTKPVSEEPSVTYEQPVIIRRHDYSEKQDDITQNDENVMQDEKTEDKEIGSRKRIFSWWPFKKK